MTFLGLQSLGGKNERRRKSSSWTVTFPQTALLLEFCSGKLQSTTGIIRETKERELQHILAAAACAGIEVHLTLETFWLDGVSVFFLDLVWNFASRKLRSSDSHWSTQSRQIQVLRPDRTKISGNVQQRFDCLGVWPCLNYSPFSVKNNENFWRRKWKSWLRIFFHATRLSMHCYFILLLDELSAIFWGLIMRFLHTDSIQSKAEEISQW